MLRLGLGWAVLQDCLVPSIWASDPSFNTMCDGTKHGDTCVGQCSAGYTGQSAQFQCNNGQLWGAPPTCAGLVCAFQGFELSVGLLASDCYGKTTGETCQMQCIRGYDLVGDPSSTCQADGSFTTPTSVCQPKTCGSLSSVAPFSTVDVADTCGNSSTFGEICMSYCDMGFDITGNTTVLICDEADTASAGYVEYIPETGQSLAAAQSSGPSCAARNCTVGIPNVLGATTDCNGKVTYETCTVEPSLGYTLQAGDSNTLQCLPDGSFNQTAPTILPGTCPDPSFGTGVGSSCQGKVIGSDCWAYCLSGWSGIPKKYVCAADVSANALLLQADSTEISCTYTGRRLNSGRRLQTGCTSTAVSAVGLSSPQYFSDCDGKADTEVCIAHCSFGWVMTETAPSIYTCSSGSLTGASLPTCTAVPSIKMWQFLISDTESLKLFAEHDIPHFLLAAGDMPQGYCRFLKNDRAAIAACDFEEETQEIERQNVMNLQLLQNFLEAPDAETLQAPEVEALRQLADLAVGFVEANYQPELLAFRRARTLADLRKPESWKNPRNWHLHLGVTNSGKTFGALQDLLAAPSGLYMAPLRLLAWEIYEKMCKAGLRCALLTGQERLGPENATHVACTVEMAPITRHWAVAVLDEIQLLSDDQRGSAWTRALLGISAEQLHVCGANEPKSLETLLHDLAASCGDRVVRVEHLKERLVPLKLQEEPVRDYSELEAGDCLVCFSRVEVLEAKSQLEAVGKRPCVVYGSLPPEVRQEQAALFNDPNSGHDVLVASDAIALGLNLQIQRVVFRSIWKFDGRATRQLTTTELRQLAGRAGRYGMTSLGRAACCQGDDLPVLREALEGASPSPTPPTRAALLPLPEQLEAFILSLEADLQRPLPFAELVERFLSIAQVPEDLYFLAQANHVIALARFLEDVRLPPQEKFVFCQAPVGLSDVASLTALHRFAREFSSGRVAVPADLRELLLDERQLVELTPRKILEMESFHKVCETYLWLAARFPSAFPDVAAVEEVRCHLSSQLSKALQLPLEHHLE
eukprot:s81_g11.t1